MGKNISFIFIQLMVLSIAVSACHHTKMTEDERLFYRLNQKDNKELVEYSIDKQDNKEVFTAQKIILNRAVMAMNGQENQLKEALDQVNGIEASGIDSAQKYKLLEKKREKYKEILKNYKNIACLSVNQALDPSTTLGKKASLEIPCTANSRELCPHHCRAQRLNIAFDQRQYQKVADRHDQLLNAYLSDQSLFNLSQSMTSIENAERYIADCLNCAQKQDYQALICLKTNEDGLDLLAPLSTTELRIWLDRCENIKDKRVQALIAYRKTMLMPLKDVKLVPELDDLPEYLSFFVKFRLAEREAYEIIKESDQIEVFIKNDDLRKKQISKINQFLNQYQLQKDRLGALWDGLLIRHDELLIPALIQSAGQSKKITNTLARQQSLDYLLNCKKCTHQDQISAFFEQSAFQLTQKWTTSSDRAIGRLLLDEDLWLNQDGRLQKISLNELRASDPYYQTQDLKDESLFLLKNTILSTFSDLDTDVQFLYSNKYIWVKSKEQIRIFDTHGIFQESRVFEQDTHQNNPCLHFVAIEKGVACISSDMKILELYGEGKEKQSSALDGMALRYIDDQYAIFADSQKIWVYSFQNTLPYQLNLALTNQAKLVLKSHKLWVSQDQKLMVYDLKSKQKKWEYSGKIDDFQVLLSSENQGRVYTIEKNQFKSLNLSDGKLSFKINIGKGKLIFLDQIKDRLLLQQDQSIFFLDEEGHIRNEIKLDHSHVKYAPFSLNQFMLYDLQGNIKIYDSKQQKLSWQSKLLPFEQIEVKSAQILTKYRNRLSLYEFALGTDDSQELWQFKEMIKSFSTQAQSDLLLSQKQLFSLCIVSQWQQCHQVLENPKLQFSDNLKQKTYQKICEFAEPKSCVKHAINLHQTEPKKSLDLSYEACQLGEVEGCIFFADQMLKNKNQSLYQHALNLAVELNHLPSKLKLAKQLYQLPENQASINKAILLFQELCDEKQGEACYQMSKIYRQKALINQANIYLQDACQYGFKDACQSL